MPETTITTMTTPACPSASLDHPTPIRVSYRNALPPKPGSHTSQYVVSTADGETLCTSRTPFCSAGRALLARGHDPLAALICTREGSSAPSFKTTIGHIAKLTVRESDKVGPVFAKYDGERLAALNCKARSAPQ